MNERLKELRRFLNLTQTQFGERVGVKGNTITGYETGIRNPSDAVVKSLCLEFRVNEEWLRTGEGDMFIAMNDSEELAAYCADLINGDEPDIAKVILNWSRLSDEDKAFLRRLIRQLFGDLLQ